MQLNETIKVNGSIKIAAPCKIQKGIKYFRAQV